MTQTRRDPDTLHVVIIGNGVAGVTAARHIRKGSAAAITIISSESDYFYSRTALMYIYMGHMTFEQTKPYEDRFWEKNRIDLLRDHVTHIDADAKQLRLASGDSFGYDVLILATGSQPNKFGWPGQDLHGVQGLYSLQDLQRMEQYTRNIGEAVVVGGGLIGIEMAEMMHSRRIDVTFLVREESYWNNVLPPDESAMINRHILSHDIRLHLSTELEEILPDSRGRVRAVKTKTGEEIPCAFVGLTAGVHPNIGVCEGSPVTTGRGILINRYFETNIPDIYAIGDCAEFISENGTRGRIEQLWYTARMHGESVAGVILGRRAEYDRGILFNSAKFFDLEYQTYGDVPSDVRDEDSLYWEHPDGTRCIRIVMRDGVVTGFNLIGMRYRHQVCERWIHEERPLTYVLEHLGEANFDPEFSHQFEDRLIGQWNERHPDQAVHRVRRRGLRRLGTSAYRHIRENATS
ncbi:MAG: NAD(P)/FAD-dependent oxidoreductase [Bacteroidetes bacterium]|nr:NAD(P)/FAD-dependent oxidoreductase [Bacteroidota bacterium]